MAGCKPIVISLGIILFLLMTTILIEASLYPTKPISNTTYIAGQAALVTWVEDGVKPLLASLGRMRIDLYAGHNTFLATIAKDVDPLALSITIFIPSSVIPAHYYHFNLRFKAASPATSSAVLSRPLPRPRLRVPSIVVYTADFSITPNPLSVQSRIPTSTSGNATQNSHFATPSLSTSSSAHPNVVSIPSPASRLAPTPTAGRAGNRTSGAVGRGLRARGGTQGAGVMRMRIGVKTLLGLDGYAHVNGWDSEEMKFELAFIVWPALIGLSMAM